MAETGKKMTISTTAGDAAVDGLLGGVIAGAIMAGYLAAAGILTHGEAGSILGLFDPRQSGSPFAGVLAHLAVSGIYGVIFSLGAWLLARVWAGAPLWLLGGAYGLGLLALASWVLLPAANSPMLTIPPVHFAIAHCLYGLTLGIGLARRRPKPDRIARA